MFHQDENKISYGEIKKMISLLGIRFPQLMECLSTSRGITVHVSWSNMK